MHLRTFKQWGTDLVVAINMDLVEVIFPVADGTGSIIRLHGWTHGEANDWQVTDSFQDLQRSLRP